MSERARERVRNESSIRCEAISHRIFFRIDRCFLCTRNFISVFICFFFSMFFFEEMLIFLFVISKAVALFFNFF